MEFTGSMSAPPTAFYSPPQYPPLLSSVHSHQPSGGLHSDPSSPSPILQSTTAASLFNHHHQQQHLSGNPYEIKPASDEEVPRWGTSPRSPFSSESPMHLHQLPAPAMLPPPPSSSAGMIPYDYSYPSPFYNPTTATVSYHPHRLPSPTPLAQASAITSSSSSSSTISWGTSQPNIPSPTLPCPPIPHPDVRSRSWSPDPFEQAAMVHRSDSKRPRTDPDPFTYPCAPLSTPDPLLMQLENSYAHTTLSRPRSPTSACRQLHSHANSAVVTTSSKKKKREVREVMATCGLCRRIMGRLTLRGSPEEMVVSGGYEVVQTCRDCQGMASTAIAAGQERHVPIPFGGYTTFTVQLPTGMTMRKRNRRTDDVTAPTTCDCCGRQLGVGGIVARNGRSAIQFAVEVVCTGCVDRYRRCTDCGGGGGSRLGVGKWRCKELFSDGRRTCVLSHQRQGGNGSGETRNVIWKVGEMDVEEVVGQVKELVKHSLYAALATPEMLESGVARVTKFEDIKTMYINGWKRIEPMMREDVEASEGRRRYVGLRWSKPHPRKGPKRPTPPTSASAESTERTLLEPGKELAGFVLAEWDMEKGTLFVAVAMPWQSGDALESTSGLTHETLLAARADRARFIQTLVASGRMTYEEASAHFPPIEHLWTILFFDRDSRLIQFIEKRKSFKRLSEYVTTNRDCRTKDFRQSFLSPSELEIGLWETWVRREGSRSKLH